MRKYLLAITMLATTNAYSLGVDNKQQVNPQGNSNVTNICQPQIKVIQKECKKCETCEKPRVVYKKKYIYKTRVVKSKPKVIVKKVRVVETRKVKRKLRKNRVKLLGGYGPNGVSAESVGDKAIAYEERGAIFGLSYDRLLNDRISVGGQILTNETYLMSVGLDF